VTESYTTFTDIKSINLVSIMISIDHGISIYINKCLLIFYLPICQEANKSISAIVSISCASS